MQRLLWRYVVVEQDVQTVELMHAVQSVGQGMHVLDC